MMLFMPDGTEVSCGTKFHHHPAILHFHTDLFLLKHPGQGLND